MSLWRIRVGWTGVQGAPWLTTLYFDELSGSAQQAATAVADFIGALEPVIVNDANWSLEPDVALIAPTTGDLVSVTGVTAASGSGSETGSQLAGATQGLIRWTTGQVVNGRILRGRTFVPGPSEIMNDDGRPNTTYSTPVQAAADGLLAAAAAELVIWHRPTDSELGTFESVQAGSVWNEWAVLRSRRD